jgi:holo-[acyl-carrier protein] synthase
MALKGIGIDIAEISRLSKIAERYGDKFLGKVYTSAEIDLCARAGGGLAGARLAGRWAAKEAFYKALPDGLQRLSSWKSVQILADGRGRPYIDVCDARLRGALQDCGVSAVHLSITHERAHCAAVVALE